MKNTIANTIYQQLGGNRFVVMTGAKNFIAKKDGLSFRIGRNKTRCNHVFIMYDGGLDAYNVTFCYVTKTNVKELETLNGIYFDELQPQFTKFTGLYTGL